MRAAIQKTGVKQCRHVFKSHRPVSHAAFGSHYLHQRFEPKHAARAVALHINSNAARHGFFVQGVNHFIRTGSQRCAIARNKQGDHAALPISATKRAMRVLSMRAYNLSSICTAGEEAQRPKQ